MRFLIAPALIGLVLASSPWTASHRAQTAQSSDSAAIVQLGAAWQNAWNTRNADALTALLTEDADFVTVLGPNGWLKGRARFDSVHTRMFPRYFNRSTWTTKNVEVRFLRPDIAIAHVLWSTTGDEVRHVKHGSPREGVFTCVLDKRGGQWLIAASQNTEVMPILPGQ